MKNINFFKNINKASSLLFVIALLLVAVSSCKDDDDLNGLPITNDFRVLQVKSNGSVISSGEDNFSVIGALDMVFSHGVNTSTLESALTISPAADLVYTYDASNSTSTISFANPLLYETTYVIVLNAGTYGAGGEASTDNFSFEFRTAPFAAPSITLSADVNDFFEGQAATVTATIATAILEEVSMDLVFGGVAILDTDYSTSAASITIPSGSTIGTIELTGIIDGGLEGAEAVTIVISNLINAVEDSPQLVNINLGDAPPSLELRGVMELDNYIDGSGGRIRAVHLLVLEDIPNLGIYGVEVASNGAAPDPNDIDFVFADMTSASPGENILIVRDADEANAMAYFGNCFNDFTIVTTDALTQNGDDAILLYNGSVAVESFGEPGVDGTGEAWEYTDSWAYKLAGEWIYAGVACVENPVGAATDATSICKYPFCNPIQLQGVSALLWDGSGTNGGKAVHVRVNRDISDLSQYSLGVANNGGGTDGIEYTFPAESASAGDHILVSREPGTIATYFGSCYDQYAAVYQSDAMSQNGDDGIELFDGMNIIEIFGDSDVDGTGQAWEYAGSWGYKVGGGTWTYGGIDCAATSTSTQSSACPYAFCN
ncbi:MAG: hypothetical protein ACJAT4_000469 [Granulosicoccus sp.]|jgi:hypothetical protein